MNNEHSHVKKNQFMSKYLEVDRWTIYLSNKTLLSAHYIGYTHIKYKTEPILILRVNSIEK